MKDPEAQSTHLAGGVAHDFNNLLIGVLGNVSLLLCDSPDNAKNAAVLKGIESSALRAAQLCRQLLAYSGRGRFTMTCVSLPALVAQSLEEWQGEVPNDITVRLDADASCLAVRVDAQQVREMIWHLLQNTVDRVAAGSSAAEKHGLQPSQSLSSPDVPAKTITLRTRAASRAQLLLQGMPRESLLTDQYAVLQVSNGLHSLDAAAQSLLFAPFSGTYGDRRGMAMAAVAGTVRGHEGALLIQSPPGDGTTIVIALPIIDAPVQPLPESIFPPSAM